MTQSSIEPWKREALQNFRLYAVTDIRHEDPLVLEKVDAACRGGADIIQLRAKTLNDAAVYRLGRKMQEIVRRHRRLFFVNDRPDLAMALEADGVHIGQDDLPVASIRRLFARSGQSLFIGKSTHSLEQAVATAGEEVDYIGFGPVYGTPTKPDYVPVGIDQAAEVLSRVRIPVVFIGGLSEATLKPLIERGAQRFAVVRAIFDEGDPYEATRRLRQLIESRKHEYAG